MAPATVMLVLDAGLRRQGGEGTGGTLRPRGDGHRKIDQFQAAFGFGNIGGVRLHHRDCFDGHGGGLCRHLHIQINVFSFPGAQFKGLKFGLLKSGGFDGELIGSDVDIDELVPAVGVRFGLVSGVGPGV
jgi:hypothetical protein